MTGDGPDGDGPPGDDPAGDGPRRVSAGELAGATAESSPDGTAPGTTVVGVLLAAGTSSRYGDANKLLAALDGEPLVRHAARTLLDGDLDAVVAVLGHEARAVGEALADLPLRTVENPDYPDGMSTSVRAGVAAAEDSGAGAAVFLPGDMPFVDPETVGRLVAAHRAGLGDALAAAHGDRRGNPVLFDARHFPALRAVEGDVGGRPVFLDSDRSALVETGDPGVTRDVDTAADLERYR